jgi:GWxTD domain-containing protein
MALVTLFSAQGDFSFSAEHTLLSRGDSGTVLELVTLIPFNAFIFVRTSEGYVARYRLTLELFDNRGLSVAGGVWQYAVAVSSYEATRSRDSMAGAVVELSVPQLPGEGRRARKVKRGRVDVFDLNSSRRAWYEFELGQVQTGARVRFYRAGQVNPERVYGVHDSVVAVVERAMGEAKPESVVFEVFKGDRQLFRQRGSEMESEAGRGYRLALAVSDSSGRPLFDAAGFSLRAKAYVGERVVWESGACSFTVQLPFYYSEREWRDRIERLVYVASVEEMRRLKSLPVEQRQAAWDSFWRPRDPNPVTEVNEQEEEYFRRIEYADEHFGGADKGYRSDRGRIYVTYGPPDQVETTTFDIDRPAQETWHYFERGLVFVFVDRYGWGEYLLVRGAGTYER